MEYMTALTFEILCQDYNGYRQEGFGKMAMTVGTNGARASTATCYLHPAKRRANLTIRSNALAHRVVFDKTSGSSKPKARGVEFSASSSR